MIDWSKVEEGYTLSKIRQMQIEEQKQEIERLQNIIEKNKYTADELNEIERLNNIIKDIVKYAWCTNMTVGEFRELYKIAYSKEFDGDFEKIEEGM